MKSDLYHQQTIELCRQLRQSPTPAEDKLWQSLRGHRLAGLKFRRQHPLNGCILDFYCQAVKLAIKVDGGVHNDPLQILADEQRGHSLEEQGIVVLRFWNDEVLHSLDRVLTKISQAAQERKSRLLENIK